MEDYPSALIVAATVVIGIVVLTIIFAPRTKYNCPNGMVFIARDIACIPGVKPEVK